MTNKQIVFYRKASGECPVEDFLDSLPSKAAQKIAWTLSLVEDIPMVPVHYFCKLTDTRDNWEFRIKSGSNIYRVFAFMDGNRVVVTNGFVKKTQKSPANEIEKAQNYKRDHLSRRQ